LGGGLKVTPRPFAFSFEKNDEEDQLTRAFRRTTCALLLMLPCAFVSRTQTAATLPLSCTYSIPARAAEVRALWVVRNTLTSPEKIQRMIESAASNGFNTLIVQVRGRGDAYYRSRWEPRAAELKDQPADFDPLATTIDAAHKRGLKVHAWLNTSLLANLDALPSDPNHVYNKHPEWLAVPRPVAAELYKLSPSDPVYRTRIVEWSKANRAELEGVYVGPANPKVREHIYRIWMDVLEKYAVDGLHFDYVRFASPDFDYSRTSLKNFRKWLEPQLACG
jgi:uncharacterized lipoprotein YddW (UPF0748 family)